MYSIFKDFISFDSMKTRLTKLSLLAAALLITSVAIADDFKVKLKVETIDYSAVDIKVAIYEGNTEIRSETLDKDGTSKLKLEAGGLYNLRISKTGYIPHWIHNVHSDGDTKFDITLYKAQPGHVSNKDNYLGANRTFVEVKAMTIPAEKLQSGVKVVKEDEMMDVEKDDLKRIQKIGKSQEKAQKKLEKLMKQEKKVKDEMAEIDEKMAEGKLESAEGEEKKLKLQKKLVKIQKKAKKLMF